VTVAAPTPEVISSPGRRHLITVETQVDRLLHASSFSAGPELDRRSDEVKDYMPLS